MGGRIGLTELLVILGLALLLFGNRLPGMGKSLGEGLRNFKKGLNGDENSDQNADNTQNRSNQTTGSLTSGQNVAANQTEKNHVSK